MSGFVRVPLARGVSIELPRAFRVLSMAERELIGTAGAAALEQTGGSPALLGANLIRANSMPPSTYAAVGVTSVMPPSVTYAEAKTLTQRDVTSQLERESRAQFEQMLALVGQKLRSFGGVRIEHFGPYPVLVQEYERSARDGGSVVVQVNSIFTPRQEVRLTLSYRKSEALMWRSLLARVRSSIAIS